jgi:hypothetical protein
MKKKELLKRIEKLEFRIMVEEKTRRADYEIITLELEALKERLNAISRIHSNHTAEEFKRNKQANEKIDLIEEGMQLLMLKDMLKGISNITKALEEQECGIDNGCKKCDEKPLKKRKKCEKTKKEVKAPQGIKVGDLVRVVKSDSVPEEILKEMKKSPCEVKGIFADGYTIYTPDKKDCWAFNEDEISIISKRGRGRPVGSKNKNTQVKGEKYGK